MSFYPYRFIYRGIYGGIFGRRLKTACRSGMCDTCRAIHLCKAVQVGRPFLCAARLSGFCASQGVLMRPMESRIFGGLLGWSGAPR